MELNIFANLIIKLNIEHDLQATQNHNASSMTNVFIVHKEIIKEKKKHENSVNKLSAPVFYFKKKIHRDS